MRDSVQTRHEPILGLVTKRNTREWRAKRGVDLDVVLLARVATETAQPEKGESLSVQVPHRRHGASPRNSEVHAKLGNSTATASVKTGESAAVPASAV